MSESFKSWLLYLLREYFTKPTRKHVQPSESSDQQTIYAVWPESLFAAKVAFKFVLYAEQMIKS